jgi:nicotinamide-nucleotide amidase
MNQIVAEIITIGDEILFGQTLDTNAHWMSGELQKSGLKTGWRTTVGDNDTQITAALSVAESRADVILITGGLGPTKDDLTKETLARYFDSEIEMNQRALAELEDFMLRRGRKLNESTRKQAELPVKSEIVSNFKGTAAGMLFRKDGKVFVAMPGIPHEMKGMMTTTVLPLVKREFQLPVIYHKIVRTAGIGESWLAEKIVDWENSLPDHIRLAYLPTFGDIKMRITAYGNSKNDLQEEVAGYVQRLVPQIREFVYGYDDDSLAEVVGRLLIEKGQKLAIAESCSGGYVSHAITSIPGCSAYFNGSVVAYQNEIKVDVLGIKQETLNEFGAVSEETVSEMANNVRSVLNADMGLATSGIAGPTGGTTDKPVGLIYIACATDENTICKKLQLVQDRYVNIRLTTVAALNLLRRRLIEKD